MQKSESVCSVCALIQALNGMKNTEKGLELKRCYLERLQMQDEV